jgi:hypothetical protein
LNKVVSVSAAIFVLLLAWLHYIPNSAQSQSISTSAPHHTIPGWLLGVIIIVIVVTASKLTHRKRKRRSFPQSVKQKTLEKQHHKCANCKRLLNVVDYHHKNGNKSNNNQISSSIKNKDIVNEPTTCVYDG